MNVSTTTAVNPVVLSNLAAFALAALVRCRGAARPAE
jgi:hypothetical protein